MVRLVLDTFIYLRDCELAAGYRIDQVCQCKFENSPEEHQYDIATSQIFIDTLIKLKSLK